MAKKPTDPTLDFGSELASPEIAPPSVEPGPLPEGIPEWKAPGAPLIHPAIVAIMREVGAIGKDKRNTSQNYNFRGVDDVYNRVHPLFARHGVYSASRVVASEHRESKSSKGQAIMHAIVTMEFTFYAADGSHVSTQVVAEGQDYGGDKASNKAMSAADKYAILQLLKIPTAMVDSDKPPSERPDADPEAPRAQPRDQRVTRADIKKAFEMWQTFAPNPDDKEAFVGFCVAVCHDDWDPKNEHDWNRDRLDAVNAAIQTALGAPE